MKRAVHPSGHPVIYSSSHPLILASASPRRLELLRQIGVEPAEIIAAEIDETPQKGELPKDYVWRMAREKAEATALLRPEAVILAADTTVACGRRILGKAEDEAQARHFLELLSGRRHRVYSSVCMAAKGEFKQKTVLTQVKFSRLTAETIERYITGGEWQGKAGGYAIQGAAAAFIPWINGSYSNVVGLPLAETYTLLRNFRHLDER